MSDGLAITKPHTTFAAPLESAAPGVATPGEGLGVQALPAQTTEHLAGQANTPSAKDRGELLIANRHGAPALAAVTSQFAPEELVLILQALKMKTQEGQLRTAKEGLGITRQKLEQEHKKSLDKLEEAIKKGESAAAKSKASKIFGWVTQVGAVVGSLVAVVALSGVTGITAGAGAPLLALAVIGLVASSISLTSSIVQAAGGPPADLNAAMTWSCKSLLKVFGVPEEKLEAASKIMAGSLGVATGAVLLDAQLVGGLASGVVQISSGSENWAAVTGAAVTALASIAIAVVMIMATAGAGSTDAAKEALKSVSQISKILQHSAPIVSSGGSLASSGLDIDASFDEHAAASAQVDRQKFSAIIAKLQALMEEDSEQITQIVKDIQESLSQVSKMIMQAGENRSQIAANLGHSMA
ncbi:type III secretion system translocon subunit SctE [Pantoea sp. 18069]|uniref:type III secretion system translocon subunit SctE n=1 Tax=Pantoea sp. 18069 TaxID=2681415 RepID=UPI00135A9F58|nr:type III secretion system translocon subunit SctE [Pantoea sp. 18069]